MGRTCEEKSEMREAGVQTDLIDSPLSPTESKSIETDTTSNSDRKLRDDTKDEGVQCKFILHLKE